MSNKQDWIWMPHAGHLIVGDECRFHLNTYLGNGYIVSTVGEWWPDLEIRQIFAGQSDKTIEGKWDIWDKNYFREFGFKEIGLDRKYETMVFAAQQNENNEEEDKCCLYIPIAWEQLDMEGYNSATEAYSGHLRICEKWAIEKPRI